LKIIKIVAFMESYSSFMLKNNNYNIIYNNKDLNLVTGWLAHILCTVSNTS
jgi:hypothetical protein